MDETTRLFIDDNLNNLDNINGDMSPKSAVPTEKLFSCQGCRKNKNNIVVKTKGRLKGGDVKQHYYIMEQTTTIEVKMNNCFNHFSQNNNTTDGEPRMTSLEIATLTGKPHNDVLKAIRKMEPAWEKVQGGKFSLLQKAYDLPNGGKKLIPYYSLTKTETLYIATKFNDEARARLVIRWEELERKSRSEVSRSDVSRKEEGGKRKENSLGAEISGTGTEVMHPTAMKILGMADQIMSRVLSALNEDAQDTLTATQVAKTFNMTVNDFNSVLSEMGIQYRRNGRWNISNELEGRGLTALRTHVSYSLKGERKVKHYMTWTIAGLHYLNAKLGYPNF